MRQYLLGVVLLALLNAAASGCAAISGFSAGSVDNRAQSIKLTAVTEEDPARVVLNLVSNAGPFQVHRKVVGGESWGDPVTVGNDTVYVDDTVEPGILYEYMVRRQERSSHKGNVHIDRAFVVTGVALPPVEERGILLLLVEESVAQPLAEEIEQLQRDLVGDGWQVRMQSVSRTASPTDVKSLIRNVYNQQPEQLKSVYLLGHLPIPYSGNHAEDGHAKRAWPADIYYGDMDGKWTTGNGRSGWFSAMSNSSKDAAFSQIAIDNNPVNHLLAPELAVGRVDFHDMPVFAPLTEVDLLRRYLQKAHRWRHGELTLPNRALIADRLGKQNNSRRGGENAWQNLAPLVGIDDIVEGDLPSAITSTGYLWAYGISTGSYTTIHGGFRSRDFRSVDPPIAFYNLFGSYFGEWDSTDNLLRATLAAPTYGLASVWGNWGRWHFHHMAMGATIGESIQATHDPSRGYHFYEHGHRTMVEMNLMGDPALRMHPMRPVRDVLVKWNNVGQAQISWESSPDAEGYFVYRKPSEAARFERLNQHSIQESAYVDTTEQTFTTHYMIRAARKEMTPSGTYINLSLGILSPP